MTPAEAFAEGMRRYNRQGGKASPGDTQARLAMSVFMRSQVVRNHQLLTFREEGPAAALQVIAAAYAAPGPPPPEVSIICRPLLRNVPTGRQGWVLTACGSCGDECWKQPNEPDPIPPGYAAACTACALTGHHPGNPRRPNSVNL